MVKRLGVGSGDMRTARAAAVAVLVAVAVVGCGRGAVVTEQQAAEGFAVAFTSYITAMMGSSFGALPDGVEIDTQKREITFKDVDVSDFDTDYTTISGTFAESEAGMSVDVRLTGGPVTTLKFDFDGNFDGGESGTFDVTVNGRKMTLGPDSMGDFMNF